MAKRKRRRHRQVRPGTRPGTIVIDKDAPQPMIDVVQFNHDKIHRWKDVSPDQIPRLDENLVTWINVAGLGNKTIIQQISTRFSVHPLAMEDVVNTHQRPKLDVYDDHLYLVLRMPRADDDLDIEQISIFLGKDYVLTWQERTGDCFDPIRERLEFAEGLLRRKGNDFFVYALTDAIIDSYFPTLSRYGDAMDEMEDTITQSISNSSVVQRLHSIRHDVRSLRRNAWSQRDVVASLIAYQGDLIDDETRLHLRDVSDHALRVVELVEICRDSCSDLQDLYMSIVSLRMNEVMKVLTIIATIFIPLGFIAGVYGMNFSNSISRWNMPETQWTYGYPFALALMLSVALAMLLFFKRLGWIGRKDAS